MSGIKRGALWDFFRREFAPIDTYDAGGEPVEALESERMYRAKAKCARTKAHKPAAKRANAKPRGSFISISPALLALCVLAPLVGQGRLMAMTVCILALHEAAHIACARALGVPIGRLRLTPLGAALELDARLISPHKEALIAAAGPLMSAGCVMALCLLTGRGMDDALLTDAAGVALAMTLFNLMPASPLDGGRILHALMRKRFGERRASDVCGILGIIMALLLMACVLISALSGRLPVMLMAAAVCVFSLAAEEYMGDTQTAWQLAWTHGDELKRGDCLPVRVVAVNADTPVRALLKGLRRGQTTVFRVTDEHMRCMGEISEGEVLTRCVDAPDACAGSLVAR